jgi:hypothetical protein
MLARRLTRFLTREVVPMAKRSPQTAGKREREQAKRERRERKQARRAARTASDETDKTTPATDPESTS